MGLGDLVCRVLGQVGPHLDLVEHVVDARQLVGREVVVDVRDVDEEDLALEEAERLARPRRVELQS